MAGKPKSLLEGGPHNALGEGAARFDRLIDEVRAQRAAPVQAPPAPAANPLLPESPGETWARNFRSQSIGPETRGVSLSDLAPVPRAMIVPPMTAGDIAPGRKADIVPQKPAAAPMGLKIGKPERDVKPRKSWLGRMFGG
jgi:hypothetical protein